MQIEIYTLVGASPEKEAKMYAKLQALPPAINSHPDFPRIMLDAIRTGALYVGTENGFAVAALFLGAQPVAPLQLLLCDDTRDNVEFLRAACDNGFERFSVHKFKTEFLHGAPLVSQLEKAGFRLSGTQRQETLIGDEWKDTVLLERLSSDVQEAPEEEEDEEEEVVETIQSLPTTPSPARSPSPHMGWTETTG